MPFHADEAILVADERYQPAEATVKIPVTLPTLKVAWMEIPYPLSEDEYKTLVDALATYKMALTTTTPPPQ